MAATLELTKEAFTIFDTVEANRITMDTATAVVRVGVLANLIHAGVQKLVLTGEA